MFVSVSLRRLEGRQREAPGFRQLIGTCCQGSVTDDGAGQSAYNRHDSGLQHDVDTIGTLDMRHPARVAGSARSGSLSRAQHPSGAWVTRYLS